ncbi:aminodeoxychorismate synthase, component I [Dermabacter vaginalis]|uniref:aminodeoxychorismate synthase n=1 Tax=Dermabacter vaginalis TaxID=1630135 RepID=A0A1B0ZJX8_9MICO|nr:aminodeoxychorismate synthase component I [Dermabacter vaginalis]ANP28311.1 aminodeoxychorismate synthase, component I [Dermabacter vaginalis]
MSVLIVDNHDSFTFNIAHLVAEASGTMPNVVLASASRPSLDGVSHVIIGPGPGTPHNPGDLGCSLDVYRAALERDIPVLGICLGLQLMAVAHGGRVGNAPTPMHGLEDALRFTAAAASDPVFANLPRELRIVRYHSLAIAECPPDLEVLGSTPDGAIQAARLHGKNVWGVQFHPESIRTEGGLDLMRAFLNVRGGADDSPATVGPEESAVMTGQTPGPAASQPGSVPATHTLLLGSEVRVEDVFTEAEALYRDLFSPLERAVWLDSASEDHRSRFSIMGACDGPGSHLFEYRVPKADRVEGVPAKGGFFDELRGKLRQVRLDEGGQRAAQNLGGFALGYVGYLGYGLGAETLGLEREPRVGMENDAHLVFLARALVIDHDRGTARAVALAELDELAGHPGTVEEQQSWIVETTRNMISVLARAREAHEGSRGGEAEAGVGTAPAPAYRHAPAHYAALIARCQELIHEGESYELCLTNEAHVPGEFDPLEVYSRLRRVARVPYGALLQCGKWSVASASPERFLEVSAEGVCESRPIKGTAPRSEDPEEDARLCAELASSRKDRAENLMIVDLVRHDLSRVCEAGSVKVPHIYQVESFPTVHQMISTITGRLSPGRTALDAIEAAFPGGSMTGAPKLRTVQLLRELEGGPRGIYSGAIGWISPNGAASLSIVIRTAVLDEAGARFGVGGAITRLSDATAEIEETFTKARTVRASLA